MYTSVFGYIIYYAGAFSGGEAAPPSIPRHRAGVLERRRVQSREGGEEVSSFEKKIGGTWQRGRAQEGREVAEERRR
jgi:hypothetical protein